MIRKLLRFALGIPRPRPPVAEPVVLHPDYDYDYDNEEIDMTKLDVKKIKHEINLLAPALRQYKLDHKQAQRERRWVSWPQVPETLVAKDPKFWKSYARKIGDRTRWSFWQMELDYTLLCALRAHMRGKLHFCPRTKRTTAEDLGIGFPITLETQADWVEGVAEGYELSDEPGRTVA